MKLLPSFVSGLAVGLLTGMAAMAWALRIQCHA